MPNSVCPPTMATPISRHASSISFMRSAISPSRHRREYQRGQKICRLSPFCAMSLALTCTKSLPAPALAPTSDRMPPAKTSRPASL
jgi:hypothetical protein